MGGFADAGADLEDPEAQGDELGLGQGVGLGDGIADGEHQPVDRGVEYQPHLIGQGRAAGGSVALELGLVQFDEVLGLAAGAVELGVDVLRAGGLKRGDDVADIEAQGCGLDTGDDATLLPPGLCRVRVSAKAAQGCRAGLGALDADGIGDVPRLGGQGLRAGDAEHIVDGVLLAEVHEFGRPY